MDKKFFKELLLFEAKDGFKFEIVDVYDDEQLYELKILVGADIFDEIIIKSDLAFGAKKWLFEKGFQVDTKFLNEDKKLKIQALAIDNEGNVIIKITSTRNEQDVILKLAEYVYNYIQGNKNGD